MPNRPWKAEERTVARLFGGARYPANSDGRVDVAGPGIVAQVKHVKTCSLARLEALAVEMDALGGQHGAAGVVKRRAGRGHPTPRLIIMTDRIWRHLARVPLNPRQPSIAQHHKEA